MERSRVRERPILLRDALQQLMATTQERQTYATLENVAIFNAVARKSGEGPECMIGAGVGNQPILRISAGELRYVRSAREQGLSGLVHPSKRLVGEANGFVVIVTETSEDGTPGVERPRTYPGWPPKESEAERAAKK